MTPIILENFEESENWWTFISSFVTLLSIHSLRSGLAVNWLASGKEHPFEIAFNDANRISSERLTSPIWKLKRWVNIGSERRLREAIEEMDELMMRLILTAFDQLKAGDSDDKKQPAHKNLISIIVNSEQKITPIEVEKKLRAEVAAKIPKLGEVDSYVPSYEEIQEVPYLEATIREVLRLYPTVPTIPYHCVRDTVLVGNTLLPAGTDVFLTLYAAGRLVSVWGPNATEFVPERFIDQQTGKLCEDTPYLAFSNGPRVCLGRNLAMLQLKIVAATIISHFHLSEQPEQGVEPILDLTIGMKNPLMMAVKPIQQAASF